MKSFIILIGLLALIPFLTATSTDDSHDEIEYKELSRERRAPCPIIRFSFAQMPTVWANMYYAINLMGKPSTLNRVANDAQKNQNRRASGCPKLTKATGPTSVTGLNCDEYPFASSTQGGAGAVIKMVVARDNAVQGGTLAAFYKNSNIVPGGCYTVQLVP